MVLFCVVDTFRDSRVLDVSYTVALPAYVACTLLNTVSTKQFRNKLIEGNSFVIWGRLLV